MRMFLSFPKRRSFIQTALTVIIIASLLAGCRFPWQAAPTNLPVTEETDSAANLTPPEPTPTPTPRPDLPPALVETHPLPGSVISLNQALQFYFNQAMDTDSVIAATRFEPDVNGLFEWENDQVLTFIPDKALPPGVSLTVSIDETAQAQNGLNLLEPVAISFTISSHLSLTQTLPEDGSQDVNPQNPLLVSFNQAVVPLGAEADGPTAFTLSPEVPGEGAWLNTSTYSFTPDPALEGGVTYTLTLNDSLTSAAGAPLTTNQPTSFKFTTSMPAVTNLLPLADSQLSLDGPITLLFNIRMAPQSVEENFTLIAPDGEGVPGTFKWGEDQKSVRFRPEALLAHNTTYTIRLGTGAQSSGGLPIETALDAQRTTYPAFTVDSAEPAEFKTYYGEYGAYTIHFTAPLLKTCFDDFVTIEPEINSLTIYRGNQDQSLTISGYFKPDTEYTLSLSADLPDMWDEPLGETTRFTFTTPPAEPALHVVTGGYSNQLVFVPADTSELILQATNIEEVNLMLAPITVDDLITLLHPENSDYRSIFMPDNLEMRTIPLDLAPNVNQAVSLPLTYQEQPLNPGVYFLELTSSDLETGDPFNLIRLFVIVSYNHVVMKVSPDQAFIWASRLSDFSALSGAPLSVYNTEGTRLARGETDETGRFIGEFPRVDSPYSGFFTLLGEPGSDNFAFSSSTWAQGYTLYQMGINLNTLPPLVNAYIYTDRPIYRPGDTIHFKAAVYRLEDGLPGAPDLESVRVSVFSDPGMAGVPSELYAEDLTLSQFGTVSGSLQIPENASPGFYHIDLSIEEQPIASLYFDVAAYRKPTFALEVALDQEEMLAGEDLTAEIQADYYFGLPLAGQDFTWVLYRDTTVFHLPGYRVGPLNPGWLVPRIFDENPFGETEASGSGQTDAAGHASLSLEDLGLEPNGSQTHTLRLEATITDESGLPVSQHAQTLVHPESFYIGIKPEAYFGTAGTPMNFSILTVDWEKAPLGEIPLEATFEAIEWEVETTTDPAMPYRYSEVTTFVASASPVTDSEGEARLSFTPPGPGTYRLTVKSGQATTQSLLWVSGASAAVWPRQSQNRVELTPDAESYQPGQIAQIFFPNPFPEGARALVTIERGRVIDSQILEITDAGFTLQIPLDQESIPNVYVSVMLFGKNAAGNPDYRQGIINLPVSPRAKTLTVDLSLNPQDSAPGETVSALLTITDLEGNPIQGEFSIAVVDKAVLALADPNAPDILDAFYGIRPLSVQTSFSLLTYATQLSLANMELGRGGGGGDMAATPQLREDFPDTAFWQADVITGTDGTARLELPMPDSLTTWVVDVRGLTDTYLVGSTTAEIVTSKDLMIQPLTPRFVVNGDSLELAALVFNNTAQSLTVDVSLQAIGATLAQDAARTQTVDIGPGESTRVNWWVTVDSVSSLDLVFQAQSGDLKDASVPVWGDLEVLQYVTPLTFSTAGQMSEAGQRLELVSLPLTSDPQAGSLTLELNPSLTSTLLDGLEALEKSPYADTVSILSRLLANLHAYQALSSLGIESPQLESNLEDVVNEGLRQLLGAQNVDGGWSWWPDPGNVEQRSNAFISAYALLGLRQAQEAGLEVNQYFLDRAVEFLTTRLSRPEEIDTPWQLDRLVFELYALGDGLQEPEPYLSGLFTRRSELSPWSLAMLALILSEEDGNRERVNTLLTDLEGIAVRSATGAYWESNNGSWLLPGTPVFNTALAVFILAKLDPATETLAPALRYLMAHRQSTHLWGSTFETAWALMAITEALRGTGDSRADFDYLALLNDTPIGEGSAEGIGNLTPVTVEIPMENLFSDSPNALVIERTDGPGSLYYRADLQTYQPAATAPAINQGIDLHRAYYLSNADCETLAECPEIEGLTLDPAEPSQLVTVVLTLNVPHDMYHVLLEDNIPAGAEIVNKSLNTTGGDGEDPIGNGVSRNGFAGGWAWWWFNQPEMYDDHILWTAEVLPAGTYTLTYQILPTHRGAFQVIPAHAWQYFYPEVQGTSEGDLFTIE